VAAMETKTTILAVDDNPVQLKLFKEMLSQHYDLRVVKAASEALNFLNSEIVDIILLDIEMPNISGFEFLADIKKIPSYVTVPIIIVSGNTSKEFLEEARKSGAEDVLIKPVTAEMLETTIEKVLKASKQNEK
jgi:CheY-like chemotaxis protein